VIHSQPASIASAANQASCAKFPVAFALTQRSSKIAQCRSRGAITVAFGCSKSNRQKSNTSVQVDTRQCAASSAAFGQRHRTVFSTSHRPPKHELEPLLNERGEGGLALGRFCAGALAFATTQCGAQGCVTSPGRLATAWSYQGGSAVTAAETTPASRRNIVKKRQRPSKMRASGKADNHRGPMRPPKCLAPRPRIS
jgi:hypothetical protein